MTTPKPDAGTWEPRDEAIERVMRQWHDPATEGHEDPCPECEDIVGMVLAIERAAVARDRAARGTLTVEALAEAIEEAHRRVANDLSQKWPPDWRTFKEEAAAILAALGPVEQAASPEQAAADAALVDLLTAESREFHRKMFEHALLWPSRDFTTESLHAIEAAAAQRATAALTERVRVLEAALAGMIRKWAPHMGSCCTFDVDGKVIVTLESCRCGPIERAAQVALATPAPEVTG